MTSATMRQAAAEEDRASPTKVELVELTIDPTRDTVARLHAYQRLYGAMPHWTLATGRPDAVQKLRQTLGVTTQKAAPTREAARFPRGSGVSSTPREDTICGHPAPIHGPRGTSNRRSATWPT